MSFRNPTYSIFFTFILLCACSHTNSDREEKSQKKADFKKIDASAHLESKSGSSTTGLLTIKQLSNGVEISGDIVGLKPNSVHGFHVHEKSDCSAKDASSAGGHFNPKNDKHGKPKGKVHHLGDLGNIKADKDGKVKLKIVSKDLKLYPIEHEYSALGKSLVVHENMDDFSSQPSGNAGDRIACGTIEFK